MSQPIASLPLTAPQLDNLVAALNASHAAGFTPNEIRISHAGTFFFQRGRGHTCAPRSLADVLPTGNYDVASLRS